MNEYLALVEVVYSLKDFLDSIRNLPESTQKTILYNFGDMQLIEGTHLLTKDLRLKRASPKDIAKYMSLLPVIKAEVNADFTSLEYLGGVKTNEGKRIKPHAHVTDGKGVIHTAAILDF